MAPPRIRKNRRSREAALVVGLAALALVTTSRTAHALQPLEDFLSAGRGYNPNNQEAEALVRQREAEADQSLGRVLPSITARGAYTRNQYEVAVDFPVGGALQHIVVTPKNQLDGIFTLDVPLIDVGGWYRIGAANAFADAARARAASTSLDTDKQIAQRYFQVIGARALVDSANRALAAAEASLQVVQQRHDAGAASDLEVDRAVAEVARSRQQLVATELQVVNAQRALESLTGVTPSEGPAPVPDLGPDPTQSEATLEQRASELPAVRAADLERRAAEKGATSARAALLPTISGSAQEHVANYNGFTGHQAIYTLGVAATLRLDYTTVATIRAQDASAAAARARQTRTELAARDAIHGDYNQVRSQLAQLEAARTQEQASVRAAQIAREKYKGGAGTQLDVIQAERDQFQAEAARIQSELDLAFARLLLRLDTGKPALAGSSHPAPPPAPPAPLTTAPPAAATPAPSPAPTPAPAPAP
jgi:outer membrane protein TolC